jgi:tetratricopeptide (TPR) repeat protein
MCGAALHNVESRSGENPGAHLFSGDRKMTTLTGNRLVYPWLSLVMLCLCLLGCGSQEGPKEAAKEKAPPAAALPAPPPVGATTPKTADEYVRQGKEFFTAAQYDQAITAYSEALNLKPQSVQAYNNRGIAYCNKQDFDQAISDFSRAIDIDPKFGKGYNNRAVAYIIKGEKDKARLDVEKAKSLGIPVNQMLIDSLKPDEVKAEEKAKVEAAPSNAPAPGKPAAKGKDKAKAKNN